MEIKVSITGIFKRIPKNLKSSVQLNDLLANRLTGDENIFAPFSSAIGYYIWNLPGDGWMKFSGADTVTASYVRSILEDRKGAVRKRLSADTSLSAEQVEQILSVPSDDYIYYRKDPLGNVSVLLVAWDYQLPARQMSSGGHFKTRPDAKKNDVILRFIEAGKPVAGYPLLIKSQGGKFTEKAAEADGVYRLPGLLVGKDVEILSADRKHDFSFTVTEDKSEYVHDVTGPLKIEVRVTKDGKPYSSANVRLIYSGRESRLETDAAGIAGTLAEYHEDSEVIADIDGNVQTVAVEYPVTGILFELHSPVAEVLVTCLKNGKPSEGENVVINIPGFETISRSTGTDGTVSEKLRFRDGADLSVSVGSETKSRSMALYNEFLFERFVGIYFSPVLTIRDTDGNAVPGYPVMVTIAGITDNYVTSDDGTVRLPEVQDRQTMEVQDGKVPSNCRIYDLDSDIVSYEFIVTLPPVEYYNVFLKCNGKTLPASMGVSLMLKGKKMRLDHDSSGFCKVRKDEIECGKDVLAQFCLGEEELGRMNVQFFSDEDDYELNINLKKRVYIWDIIKRILAVILTVLLYLFVLGVLEILVMPY